jgi:hypothetical protein
VVHWVAVVMENSPSIEIGAKKLFIRVRRGDRRRSPSGRFFAIRNTPTATVSIHLSETLVSP